VALEPECSASGWESVKTSLSRSSGENGVFLDLQFEDGLEPDAEFVLELSCGRYSPLKLSLVS
jgi:hypothetical protein